MQNDRLEKGADRGLRVEPRMSGQGTSGEEADFQACIGCLATSIGERERSVTTIETVIRECERALSPTGRITAPIFTMTAFGLHWQIARKSTNPALDLRLFQVSKDQSTLIQVAEQDLL
jgi:hypothetical protein